MPPGASVVYDLELLAINGRMAAITSAELDSYQVCLARFESLDELEPSVGALDKNAPVGRGETRRI